MLSCGIYADPLPDQISLNLSDSILDLDPAHEASIVLKIVRVVFFVDRVLRGAHVTRGVLALFLLHPDPPRACIEHHVHGAQASILVSTSKENLA